LKDLTVTHSVGWSSHGDGDGTMQETGKWMARTRNTCTFVSQPDVTRRDFVFVWRGSVAGRVKELSMILRTSHVIGLILGVIVDVPSVDETTLSVESTDAMTKWGTI
jgi:hypothetical protein